MSITITPIAGTDIRLMPGAWPLPDAMRNAVPDTWACYKAQNPALWDGRILGFTPPVVGADGVLRAEAREDAYSAFLTWRGAGFPEIGVCHMFGTALIVSRDGALICGVMGPDTANAGQVYPPGGSLEPRDVDAHGRVDVENCIRLELEEETGLKPGTATRGQLLAIFEGSRLSIARVFRFDMDAAELVTTIRANLEVQEERELADVVACRSPEDGRAAGPLAPYAAEILAALSSGRLVL